MVAPTPKFKSAEMRQVLVDLKAIFDAHSLGVTLVDALERPVTEQIYAKFARPAQGGRMANIKKVELVGELTSGFFGNEEVAYQIVKELDRACQKERHIVASIPEDQAPDRIGSYRALALKRERAKLVWGLARDDRPAVRALANRVIKEFFAEAAVFEASKAVIAGDAEQAEGVDKVDLARSLQTQADQLTETAKKLTDLESQVSRYEDERARLLAQIGSRERELKQESAAREEVEGQLSGLKRALETVESEQRAVEAAKASEVQARAVAEDLAQKVRRLEKLAAASKTLTSTQEELERERQKREELDRLLEKIKEEQGLALAERAKEEAKLRAELDAQREELHRVRKQVQGLERLVPEGAKTATKTGGVLVLLDQANLAASAGISFRRKVNFSALYDRLRAGREINKAIAFVVDNGGAGFDAFCDTMRKSGWELRVKKPRVFANGEVKADWDMGIAIEAIEKSDTAETVVLVSGDGDFVPLVKHLRRAGKRVEVASFPDGLSMDLANAADGVTRLDTGTLE